MDPSVPKSVGLTALAVAFARSLESNKPEGERLFYDPYAKFLTGGTEEFWTSKISAAQIQKMQGIALRTRFIDDFINEHTSKGKVRQIVILGAGMDCRALRLPLPSDAHVYEVDLEEVLKFKNDILEKKKDSIEWNPPLNQNNRHCISMDLSLQGAPWKKSLLESSYQRTQPTLWLIEGLLMYLSPDEIQVLAEAVGELSVSGSYIVAQHGGSQQNTTTHKMHEEINAPIKSYHTFPEIKCLLESCGFSNIKKLWAYEMGNWATKRIEECGIKKEELEGGYYSLTAEKL